MSNGRKPKVRPRNTARCAVHGGRIEAGSDQTVTLRDGRQVCGRCVGTGVLAQRLPCGHTGIPGTLVIADSADNSNFQCVQCSPHASRPRGYPGA